MNFIQLQNSNINLKKEVFDTSDKLTFLGNNFRLLTDNIIMN